MPELPEVETARVRLDASLCGKKIVHVWVDADDYLVFDEAEPRQVAKALRHRQVVGTGRKGKYFWLELDRKPWPVMHFGMTGDVKIECATKNRPARPRFCRMQLVTDDGTVVAFTDPRRFGRIRLADDPLTSKGVRRLGADPLFDFPSSKILQTQLARRRVAIKAVLLDQTVFAGVGNWIADETLYQAGISPRRAAFELSVDEIQRLRKTLMSVLRLAVRVQANDAQFPKNWLFHHRWGKKKTARDANGRRIQHVTLGGRTTAWVPEVQR